MTTTGSIYASFPNPGTNSTGCGAANIDGVGYVFVLEVSNKHAYRIGMAAGSIYSSWAVPGLLPRGIDYCGDGGNYVYCIEQSYRILYFMDAYTGSIYRSHTLDFVPGDVAYDPRGSSGCGCDGTYVYVGVSTWFPQSLYNVLKFETSGIGVAPKSLGKIKAIFR